MPSDRGLVVRQGGLLDKREGGRYNGPSSNPGREEAKGAHPEWQDRGNGAGI
jgi:hypothetical protein